MINDVLNSAEEKMRTSTEVLKKELAGIRTGRASTALVEHIRVDYSGVPTPLNQISRITAPEARLLIIQPWDKSIIHGIEKAILKSDLGLTPLSDGNLIRLNIPPLIQPWEKTMLGTIEKAIMAANIGLMPVNNGEVIRINIPPLTEERRIELTKLVKKRVEEGKVAIRNVRHDALAKIKELEKNKEISQDDEKRAETQLQKVTDAIIVEADQIGRNKEADLTQL